MAKSVFILGAGFSLAANRQYPQADSPLAKRYPLASELGSECFGASWNHSAAVEAAFEAAVRSGNREPIKRLVKLIQTADYHLGWPEAQDGRSSYARLIDRFIGAQFLSFNYDSLLEQVLLHRCLWNPHDGFGVPVETGAAPQNHPDISQSQILHLHGSVLLYAVEFSVSQREAADNTLWMKSLKEPRFVFDPDNLGHCFAPFEREAPGLGYRHPDQRIIVPVPDKTQELMKPYVRAVYARAQALLGVADRAVSIGYRFAECDRASFDPLVLALVRGGKPLCVVDPHAGEIVAALRKRYAELDVTDVRLTFEEWSESGFRLPEEDAA